MIVVGTHTIFIYKYSRSQLVNFINWFWLCFKKRKKPAFCKLLGVGAKVADYVCQMSLDNTMLFQWTHVWQITAKHYMPQLTRTKSLTTKVYRQIV